MAETPNVPIYDISGHEPVLGDIHPNELQDAVLSGKYSLPKGTTVPVISPEGELGDIESHEAHSAFGNGYEYATPDKIKAIKYGTTEQMVKTAAEGVAKGFLGPLAPLAEKHILGVQDEDIRGREETRPITSGIGQAVGLTAGLLTGTGEAALMTKAGEAAEGLAGLSQATKLGKVGSEAVKQAAEMAVLQSGDEIGKMILNDPDTSAESAIANIGLSAAFGAGTGAFITGAVHPLWEATAGKRLDSALNTIKDHMNGMGKTIPEGVHEAANTLGIEIPSEILGANASETHGANYTHLKRMENPAIKEAEVKLSKDVSDSVASSLGVKPSEVESYSTKEMGDDIEKSLKDNHKSLYGDFEDRFNARNKAAEKFVTADEDRLKVYDRIIEKGINSVGTDSPYYKQYKDLAERVLAKDTIGGLDQLATEIGGKLSAAYRSGDSNEINLLKTIRSDVRSFQEGQILKRVEQFPIKLKERAALHSDYSKYRDIMETLGDHLGIDFKGAKSFAHAISEVPPEKLVKKFSFKDNVEMIPFLQQHFPNVYNDVKQAELKNFIKPAVLSAKDGTEINANKLADLINKAQAGKKEYVNALFSPEALEKIKAADTLKSIVPQPKNSGTPAGIMNALKNLPTSAMAVIGSLSGHSPIGSALLGHVGHAVGTSAPDAIKLGLLRFAGSSQPVNAPAFKAAVDFTHNVIKGQTALNKATAAIFKSGVQVLADKEMPMKADREKLDKEVSKVIDNPDVLTKYTNGQTGHYMPDHQASLLKTSTQAMNYLAQIKPKPTQTGPLDRPIPPSSAQMARYERAQDIAITPSIVLQHVKEGTLQQTDVQDVMSMYPSLYTSMKQKIMNSLVGAKASEEPVPYRTRMAMSMFLGQPMDSSMQAQNIIAAQPMPKMPPQQPTGMPKKQESTSKLGKTTSNYMTPNQAAESHRQSKE